MWELGECFSGGLGSAEHGDLGGLFSNLNDSMNQWKLAESKTCPAVLQLHSHRWTISPGGCPASIYPS